MFAASLANSLHVKVAQLLDVCLHSRRRGLVRRNPLQPSGALINYLNSKQSNWIPFRREC